ncbi:hypothetical protein [Faecalibacterium prausnitzii]|uniref:hypothetical protein n=1 Tax=Faecalibacterium prausnitzii TaxID=853 RepID=UPI0022E4F3E5|nr:hypothetical protein [Faecalibacterium prausnitzii]
MRETLPFCSSLRLSCANTSHYPDEVIDRLAREFAAWQAEQAHHSPGKEKQRVPDGERPVVHIAVVCGFNCKFYKQRNSQRPVCDMQFTVVANESDRESRWQGASYSGRTLFLCLFLPSHKFAPPLP